MQLNRTRLCSARFHVNKGPNSYRPLDMTKRLLTGGMASSGRCLTRLMNTLRGSEFMEGKTQVPEIWKGCRRPVPMVSNMSESSNVPVAELVNFTAKRMDSPDRTFAGDNEQARSQQ